MWSSGDAYRHQATTPRVDALISKLATGQHRLVRLDQLRALGLGKEAVHRRNRSGFLHRVGRGVYAVGSPSLSQRGRWLAAVWSCGLDAVLSHRSAAALHEVRRDQRRRIDVTVPAKRQGHDGIDVHRTRSLRPDEVTVIDGIPVTTVARTLVDLADVLSPAAFRRAVHEADYRRLHAPLVPIPGRKGAALVEAVAAERADPQLTRTALEHAFLALIRSADLPEPKVNHHIHLDDRLVERDFVWPELKLIVEVDGRRAHTTRRAFEEDRRTDAELHRRGWHTARFSERQVTRDPAWVSGVTTELTLARRGRTIVV